MLTPASAASGHAGPTIVDAQEGSLEVDEDDDYYEDEFPGSMNALIGGVTDRRLFPMNKKPGFCMYLFTATTIYFAKDVFDPPTNAPAAHIRNGLFRHSVFGFG